MITAGLIGSLDEGRELIAKSVERKVFQPQSVRA
jgi:hypothetical protein